MQKSPNYLCVWARFIITIIQISFSFQFLIRLHTCRDGPSCSLQEKLVVIVVERKGSREGPEFRTRHPVAHHPPHHLIWHPWIPVALTPDYGGA